MSERRCEALVRMTPSSSRVASSSGPSTSLSKTSAKPRMALSGVRSSWLSAARKRERSPSSAEAKVRSWRYDRSAAAKRRPAD